MLSEVTTPGPGQCVLHNFGDRLFVERADPQVAISRGFFQQLLRGEAHPDVSLDGRVLVISGANQVVRYRLEASGQPGFFLGRAC